MSFAEVYAAAAGLGDAYQRGLDDYELRQGNKELAKLYGDQLSSLTGGAAPGGGLADVGSSGNSALPSFTRLQGGEPSANIKGILASASEKYGLDPSFMPRLAMVESSGNPNAHNPSGASGLLQFMPKTARSYGLSNPYDPVASADAGARLTLDNRKILANALGREPTQGELYLGHQQGAGGAAKLLANPNARAADIVGRAAVVQNGGTPDMSAGEFSRKWTSKFPSVSAFAGGGGQRPMQVPTGGMPGQGTNPPIVRPQIAQAAAGDPDMPAPGAVAAQSAVPPGFNIPQGQPDFVPGSVASPAIAQPQQMQQPSIGAPPRVAPQDAARLRAMLASRSPQVQQMAMQQIQKLSAPEKYDFKVVGDQVFRTTESGRFEPIGINKPASYQTFKGDDGVTYAFNPQTMETRRMVPGADKSRRDLTPEEKQQRGIEPNVFAQVDADGQVYFPGKPSSVVNLDQKREGTFAGKAGGALADRLDAMAKEGDTARVDTALIGQLETLGDRVGTGGLAAVQGYLADKGIKLGDNVGAVEAYGALIDRLTPAQRIPGTGATSDFDAKLFKSSLPRLINTPDGNALILNTLKAVTQDKAARAAIAEQGLLGPEQGGLSIQDAMKQLRSLPSPNDIMKKGLAELQQSGKLGRDPSGGATAAPSAGAPQQSNLRPMPDGVRAQAQKALQEGRDPQGVANRLRSLGFDPGGL